VQQFLARLRSIVVCNHFCYLLQVYPILNKFGVLSSMRAVIQRVSSASVAIGGDVYGAVQHGFMVLLGIEAEDTQEDAEWLCAKIAKLRVFADENGLMNNDIITAGGNILVVSQFTLHAAYKKGNRPSFIKAARPEQAIPLYEHFIASLSVAIGQPVATGKFGADMQVALVNDGPVTIIMDTKNKE
jgi:D-tyrosyl-tRNA(Tyr) deacylase